MSDKQESVSFGLHFSTVYVRDVSAERVRAALVGLMEETEHQVTYERGLEPTPDEHAAFKPVRSFVVLPEQDGWVTILEDGHPLDDGGLGEGLSDILRAEVVVLSYSDRDGAWSFTKYWEGQPLEAGGSENEDYDVLAMDFVEAQRLPYFGVYYEEVAAALGGNAPALAGALEIAGDIVPRVPLGTEVLTFRR
jgi:hypothetical protein